MEALNCEWCMHPIAAPLIIEKKNGDVCEYNACDKDCAHGLDVLDRIDEIVFLEPKLKDMPLRHRILESEEDESSPPEENEPEAPATTAPFVLNFI